MIRGGEVVVDDFGHFFATYHSRIDTTGFGVFPGQIQPCLAGTIGGQGGVDARRLGKLGVGDAINAQAPILTKRLLGRRVIIQHPLQVGFSGGIQLIIAVFGHPQHTRTQQMAPSGGIVGGNCAELAGVVDERVAIGVEPEFAIGRQRSIAFP